MIISFDGNVFTGKTTIISKLSSKYGFNKIVEYCDILKNIPLKDTHDSVYKNEQVRYLKVDKKRMLQIHNGTNLLDRSFISMSAHVYAIYKKGLFDMRLFYLKELEFYFNKNEIIIPNKYIIVSCSYKTALKRYKLNNAIKKTGRKYIDKEYFDYIDIFNEMWSREFPTLIINSDRKLNYKKTFDFICNKQNDSDDNKIILIIKKLLDIPLSIADQKILKRK
ncbi:MAG: hypothetical protein U9P90_02915 [Patescibacteria group bacterium]|nr:hypothetical protein [Patescibacteria group bacterium]